MKTVHGAEFYANKRHKGTPSHSNRSDDGHGGISNTGGLDGSHRMDDIHSGSGGKNTSISSPSIKSESDTNSPDQPINSPMSGISSAVQHNTNGGLNDDYEYMPSSMVMSNGPQIIGDSVSALDDPTWPFEDEDLEVIFLLDFFVSFHFYIFFCFLFSVFRFFVVVNIYYIKRLLICRLFYEQWLA